MLQMTFADPANARPLTEAGKICWRSALAEPAPFVEASVTTV
jgi:hypothetical protein